MDLKTEQSVQTLSVQKKLCSGKPGDTYLVEHCYGAFSDLVLFSSSPNAFFVLQLINRKIHIDKLRTIGLFR